MFRKLSLALAVSAALSPVGVFALGLGDMSTTTALNEKFNANIELLSVAPGELDSIKVTLASSADFARAGLERPFVLSKLRFEPIQLDDGRPVIRITTRDPVREPFLNFLLEVNWPKGRLIREFTVLLDPPVTLERRPPAIAPAVTAPLDRVSRASPESQPPPLPETVAETMPPAVEPVLPEAASVGEYGPVQNGVTLWGIARELEIPGATVEQVAVALFRHNPRSFAGYDINRLMAGEILRIPDQDFIESLSPRQARSEFFARVEGRPGTVPFSRAGRLRIATKPSEKEQQPAETRGGEIERVKTDIRMVRETSESTRQETDELRSRIRELESQLTDIRSLLKLKSDQLAQMQVTQMDQAAPPEGVSAIVPTGDETPPVDSELAEAAKPGSEAMQEPGLPEDGVEAEEAAAQELTPVPVLTEELVEEAVTLAEIGLESTVTQESEANEQAKPETSEQPESRSILQLEPEPETQPEQAPMTPANQAEEAPPAALKHASSKPVKQPELLDELRSDPTIMGIGGAVAVVLLSLGWLLIRRRRQADDQIEEGMLERSGEDSTTFALDSASDVAEQRDSEEETSFISDFSPSDIDALQEETGEVDPAAEADVYIAYGRYQQAESLVNLAIEKEPERLDLKTKLLEIYFTTRNAAAFAGLAEKLQSIGAETKAPQLWKQVESMGRELIPGHELFGSADGAESGAVPVRTDFTQVDSGAVLVEESAALTTDSEALAGLGLDLGSELSEISDQPRGRSGDSATASPLELTEESGLPSSEPSLVPETAEEESEFSIDLADLDSLEEVELGDLGLEGSEQMDVAIEQPAASPVPAETHDGLSLPTEEPEALSFDELDLEASTIDLDQLDLEASTINLDQLDLEEAKEIKTGDNEPLSELLKETPEYGDEEIETKLDLARAYMDMGDGEGAREILKEVLGEGSDEQRSVAQGLMKQAS